MRTRPPHGLIIDVPQRRLELRVVPGAHLDGTVMGRVDVVPVDSAVAAANPLTEEQAYNAHLTSEAAPLLA